MVTFAVDLIVAPGAEQGNSLLVIYRQFRDGCARARKALADTTTRTKLTTGDETDTSSHPLHLFGVG